MWLCSSLTGVGLAPSLLAHPVLICTGRKMLYFRLYSNILSACCFDFKGQAGGVGGVKQGASQSIVAMVSRPCTPLGRWQERRSLSPGGPRAGTLASGHKAARAAAGEGSPLLQLCVVQPWAKAQMVSPLGTASPRWHALRHRLHAKPVQSRAALPEATRGSLGGARQRIFCRQRRVSVQGQRVLHLRAPSSQLQAGQVPAGKAALLHHLYQVSFWHKLISTSSNKDRTGIRNRNKDRNKSEVPD